MTQFEKIYQENYTGLYRVARKMVINHDDANDIVQEVFVYLFKRLQADNQIITHINSWLYRAVCNKCADAIKSMKSMSSIDKAVLLVESNDYNDNDIQKQLIGKAIATLNEKEKAVVILYSEGLTYKEIAEVTEIKFTSVGKTIARSLKKLENELKHKKHELFG